MSTPLERDRYAPFVLGALTLLSLAGAVTLAVIAFG
jgi:hypothetical protein